jgi:hypothetical protein
MSAIIHCSPCRDLHILEDQLGGRGPLDAHLGLLFGHLVSGEVLLDDKGGDAFDALGGVGHGHDDDDIGHWAVRDEVFGSVDDVCVTLFDRPGTHRSGVGTGAGLGQAKGGEHLAGGHPGAPLLLLLFTAADENRLPSQRLDLDDQGGADAGLGDLFHGQTGEDVTLAASAVLLGDAQTQQAHLLKNLLDIPGKLGLGVDLGRPGLHLFLDHSPHLFDEHLVVFVE